MRAVYRCAPFRVKHQLMSTQVYTLYSSVSITISPLDDSEDTQMQRRSADFTKLQVFIPGSLRREIGVAAEEAGQALTVWVARTLAAAVAKTTTTDTGVDNQQYRR
jgi:hypothetical protein